mmetsp:Transcript_11246/g.16874  ORF Transcript_11246/g.16874 Transcript_11246/m.16874 type:complete len:225 (+) Transcript_11246:67-741(+)
MFDPKFLENNKKDQGRRDVDRWIRNAWSESKALLKYVEGNVSELRISIREVVCNDPECAPIDTFIAIFAKCGMSTDKIPKQVDQVTKEDVEALVKMMTPRLLDQCGFVYKKNINTRCVSIYIKILSLFAIIGVNHLIRRRKASVFFLLGAGGITCVTGGCSILYYRLATSFRGGIFSSSGHRSRKVQRRQHAVAALKRARFAVDTSLRIPKGCPCCDPRIIMSE